jgi:hypothetical protein
LKALQSRYFRREERLDEELMKQAESETRRDKRLVSQAETEMKVCPLRVP